ncbi:MAG: histidinol-phosphatase [Christensenellaceae bacterium]|nr:histidinol-phosphatase [Christensenellaceae bacterium]
MHAFGSDEEYVKAAIKAGIKELGFSDHTPWPYDNFKSHMRMEENQLTEYIESLVYLKDKYSNKICIKIGLECEYFPDYIPWLKETYEKNKLDFLILGIHFYPTDQNVKYMHAKPMDENTFNNYLLACIKGMETGMFEYLAHPDLFLRFVPKMDKKYQDASIKIIKKAKSLDLPLEYNLNSLYYKSNGFHNPSDEFWKLVADYNAPTIIGFDAHSPQFLTERELYINSKKYLKNLGIKPLKKLELKS